MTRAAPEPAGIHTAILLAAGSGSRMADATPDKILLPLGGKTVFSHVVRAFAASGVAGEFLVVFRDTAQRDRLQEALETCPPSATMRWTEGGARRQDSVYNALHALEPGHRLVFIHDCARPLVRPETIRTLAALASEDGAACLAHRVTDTLKRVDDHLDPSFDESIPAADIPATRRARLSDLDRRRLWAMETPQVFDFDLIREAYSRVRRDDLSITDDASAASLLGHRVTLLENPHPNPKLTRPGDIAFLRFLLQNTP